MTKAPQTVIISARVRPHVQTALQRAAERQGSSMSAVLEGAVLAYLADLADLEAARAKARLHDEAPSPAEAILAFHRQFRVDDAMKDLIASSWLEYRSAQGSGNVIPLRRLQSG